MRLTVGGRCPQSRDQVWYTYCECLFSWSVCIHHTTWEDKGRGDVRGGRGGGDVRGGRGGGDVRVEGVGGVGEVEGM